MASKKFTTPTADKLKKTLAQKFIPLADQLRDLAVKFGLRPYIVRIVRVRWAGVYRGEGACMVEQELTILPTPLVTDMGGEATITTPVGMDEFGQVIVSEISGRFTEDELRFVSAEGKEPEPNEEVFYEIEFPRLDGKPSAKRRFMLAGVPDYRAGKLQWQIRLERMRDDRFRNGDPGEMTPDEVT